DFVLKNKKITAIAKLDGGSDRVIYSVTISRDGNYIISAGYGGSIWIWDVKDKQNISDKPIAKFTGHSGVTLSLAISSDGNYLFSGGGSFADHAIKIWDISNKKNPKLINTITDHNIGVNSIAISFDGNYLVSGANDRTIKIW